jgi:hypothetical protein
MKLERGIIEKDITNQQIIYGVGAIYFLKNELVRTVNFIDGQRLLGLPKDNVFNVCYKITLKNNDVYVGYFVEELQGEHKFQILQKTDDFSGFEYISGDVLKINFHLDLVEITPLTYN